MKKVLLLVLYCLSIFSKTLIVDGDGDYCEEGDKYFSTIQKALKKARNNDTVKICAGDYQESNLKINKKITVTSGADAYSPYDVYVHNDDGSYIFVIQKKNVTIKNIMVEQDADVAAIVIKKSNTTLKNLVIESEGEGVKITEDVSYIELRDLYLKTRSSGIYSEGKIKKSTFKNIRIDSRESCIDLKRSDDLNITADGLNSLLCAKSGIYIGEKSGAVTIDNSVIDAKDIGISFKGNIDSLAIRNVYMDLNEEGSGIYAIDDKSCDGEIQGTFLLIESEIYNGKYEGVCIGKIEDEFNISNTIVLNFVNYAIYLKKLDEKGVIKKNIISSSQRGDWNTGLRLLQKDDEVGVEVENNCFYDNSEEDVYNYDKDAHFSQNYYEKNEGDSYTIPPGYVTDSSPWQRCNLLSQSFPKILAQWRFDECWWKNDGDVADTVGSYNGTAKNGVSLESNTTSGGILCKVAHFDGEDHYIDVEKIYEILRGTASLSFWIKTEQKGDNTDWRAPGIVGVEEYGGEDDIFWGWIDENGHIGVSKGDNDNNSRSKTSINDGKWHHVVLCRNAENGLVKIYIDGRLDKVGVTDAGVVGNEFHSIGRIENTNTDIPFKYFQGYLDEVKVFEGILSLDEVKRIYENEKSRKNYDGTVRVCEACRLEPVLEYRLDECSNESNVTDASGNGLDGAIIGKSSFEQAKVCRGAKWERDGYIKRDDDDRLDGTQSLSILFWFKADSLTNPNANASGLFAKRNASGDEDAYGAFFWNDHSNDGQQAKLFVDIDRSGQGARKSSNMQFHVGEWYFVTIVFDGRYPADKRLKIYVDGVLDAERKIDSTAVGNYSSPLYVGNLRHNSEDKLFDGTIDEFRIVREPLHPQLIKRIYEREYRGRNWWDGSQRDCRECSDSNYQFNAWDTFRTKDDQNISTKIIAHSFDLTIAALNRERNETKEFNGTVCVQLISQGSENNLTPWNKMEEFLHNVTESNWTNIEVPRAVKEARVKIVWKQNSDESCPLAQEDNSTLSSDSFAIRPRKFGLSVSSANLYAGENFQIDFMAVDENNNSAIDYNETKDDSFKIEANVTKNGCRLGTFAVDSFTFSDGSAQDVEGNYSEAGELNITIAEINGSEFAAIDQDDTDDNLRLIAPESLIIRVAPYEINVTDVTFQNSFFANWLYMAQEMNETNITLAATLVAFNVNGDVTKDYNESCYGSETFTIAFTFERNNTSAKTDGEVSVLYKNLLHSDVENGTNLSDLNVRYDRTTADFFEGRATTRWAFEIEKNVSDPLSPIFIRLVDVNVSGTGAKLEHNASAAGAIRADMNTTFYYARFVTQDILTDRIESRSEARVLVFSKDRTIYVHDYNETLIDWYLFSKHNADAYGKIVGVNASFSSSLQDRTTDLALESGYSGPAIFEINVTNNATPPLQHAYIHLNVSPWLWYVPPGFGDEYSYASDSGCLQHPCFTYTYIQESGRKVKSGDTDGTNLGDIDISSDERGVRIFR